jgi:hypothetical protein
MVRLLAALLAFSVEAAALWAYGAWAFQLPMKLPARIAAALGAVVGVGAFWGLLLAPRARRRLRGAMQPLAKIAVFAGAMILICATRSPLFAVALASLAAVSLALEYLMGIPPVMPASSDP